MSLKRQLTALRTRLFGKRSEDQPIKTAPPAPIAGLEPLEPRVLLSASGLEPTAGLANEPSAISVSAHAGAETSSHSSSGDFNEAARIRQTLGTLQSLGIEISDATAQLAQDFASTGNGGSSALPFVGQSIDQIVDLGDELRQINAALIDQAELTATPNTPGSFTLNDASVMFQVGNDAPTEVNFNTSANNFGDLVSDLNSDLSDANLGNVLSFSQDGSDLDLTAQNPSGGELPEVFTLNPTRLTAGTAAPQYGQLNQDLSLDLEVTTTAPDTPDDLTGDSDAPQGGTTVHTATINLQDKEVTNEQLAGYGQPFTNDNINRGELVDDLNAALGQTNPQVPEGAEAKPLNSLDNDIRARLDNGKIVLAAVNPRITGLKVTGGDENVLGFAADQSVTEGNTAAASKLGLNAARAAAKPSYDLDSRTIDSNGDFVESDATLSQTVNALKNELTNVLSGFGDSTNLNWQFDSQNKTVTFDLDLSRSFNKQAALDFTQGLDLPGTDLPIEFAGKAQANISANASLNARLGLDLGALGADLDFDANTPLSALNDGEGVALLAGVEAAQAARSDGTIVRDDELVLLTNGGPSGGGQRQTVSIKAADTLDNTSRRDLASDLNDALAQAGLDQRFQAAVQAGGDKLVINVNDESVRQLEVTGGQTLGFQDNQNVGFADLSIEIAQNIGDENDGIQPVPVDLSGAQTIGDVKSKIETQVPNVTVTIDSANDRLQLTPDDQSKTIEVAANRRNGVLSQAAFRLGIAGISSPTEDESGNSTNTLNGQVLHGKGVNDRLFVVEPAAGDPATLNLGVDVSVPEDSLNLAAGLGLVSLNVTNQDQPLQFNIGSTAKLKDPGTGDNADGRIYLSEIGVLDLDQNQDNDGQSDALGSLVETSGSPINVSGSGKIELRGNVLASQSQFTGELAALSVNVPDASDPKSITFDVTQADFDELINQFEHFTLGDAIGAATQFVEQLQQSQQNPILNAEIPVLNTSINDAVSIADQVLEGLNSVTGGSFDPAALRQVRDQVESGIANLSADQAQTEAMRFALESLNTAISPDAPPDPDAPQPEVPDALRNPGRLIAAIGGLERAAVDLIGTGGNSLTGPGSISDAVAQNTRQQELIDAINLLKDQAPTFDLDKASQRIETAINQQFPNSDPASFSFEIVDFDDRQSSPGMQYAIVGSFGLSKADLVNNMGFSPELLGTKYGPIDIGAGGSFNLQGGAELNLTFGVNLGSNPTGPATPEPFIVVNEDSQLDADPTELILDAGFTGTINANIGIGAFDAVQVTGEAALANSDLLANGLDLSQINPNNSRINNGDPNDDGDRAAFTVNLNPAASKLSGNSIGALPVSELGSLDWTDQFNFDGAVAASLDLSALGQQAEDAIALNLDLSNLNTDFSFNLDEQALQDLFEDVDFDLTTIVSGIDQFLGVLESGLSSEVLGELPLVGEELNMGGTFVGDLRSELTQPFLEFLQSNNVGGSFEAASVAIGDFLYNQLTNVGFNNLQRSDIVVRLTPERFEIEFPLEGRDEIAGVAFDPGLAGVPVSAEGGLTVGYDYDLRFGVGVGRNEGPYLITNADGGNQTGPEYNFDIGAGLAVDTSGNEPEPTEVGLDLFGLQFTATDNNNGAQFGTGATGSLSLDVKNGTAGENGNVGRLPINEITGQPFGETFTASAGLETRIDLALEAAISQQLPSVSADLVGDWTLNIANSGPNNSIETTFDQPSIGFQNVGLELGDFLSDTIGRPVQFVANTLEPVQPLVDILNSDVPGVSQISQALGKGPVKVIDLALMQKPDAAETAKKFLSVADTVFEVADLIDTVGDEGDVGINFGDFGFGPMYGTENLDPSSDGFNPLDALNQSDADDGFIGAAQQALSAGNGQVENLFSQMNADPSGSGDGGGLGIDFSLLQPANVFKLLIGENADIIQWDIPRLELGFEWSQSFPIVPFPPISLGIGLGFDAAVDLGVGYDTRGIQTGNFFDGFYFADHEILQGESGFGEDIDELVLGLEASLSAALDAGIVTAGVRGTVRGEFGADLRDPDDNGKLYVDEIAGIIDKQGIECLFELSAEIKAIASVFYEVRPVGPSGELELVNETIFETDNADACPKVIPAHVSGGGEAMPAGLPSASDLGPGMQPGNLDQTEDGDLVIHAGKFADQRGGGSSDTAEAFTVTEMAPDVFKVEGMGLSQRYTDVQRIIFDGGKGKDELKVQSQVAGSFDTPIIASGGAKRDVLAGSTQDDVIIGGQGGEAPIHGLAGDDYIDTGAGDEAEVTGGDGADIIHTGRGNEGTVRGGQGNDTINTGAGNDAVVTGGPGDDTIDTGAGSDGQGGGESGGVRGGAGADTITTGSGSDRVFGGTQNDTIQTGSGADFVRGGDGDDTIETAAGIDDIAGGRGNDTIDAGLGSEQNVYGGQGNDTIRGGGGSDVLNGGSNLSPANNTGNDTIYGGPGRDTVHAGDGADELYGDGAADTLNGGAGADKAWGGLGNDILVGGTGRAEDDGSSDDTLRGEIGNDFIIGGHGGDLILGGWGEDVLLGHLLRNPGGTAGDHIEGGPDDDHICGTGGPDVIHGGSSDQYIHEVTGPADIVDGAFHVPVGPGGFHIEGCDAPVTEVTTDPISITARKFADTNGNGVNDSGESFVSGQTIELVNSAGNVARQQTTDSNGEVVFADLDHGSYTVREVLSDEQTQTQPADGSSFNLDVSPGDHPTVTFGNAPTGTIEGNKWDDIDRDGKRDADEPAKSGTMIHLIEDTNNNGQYDPGSDALEASQATDSNGHYQFTGLEPGAYIVQEQIPEDHRQTFPAPAASVYADGFEEGADDVWSSTQTTEPPSDSANAFLGTFQNETVTLDVNDLPEHETVTLGFDLHVIGGWEGIASSEPGENLLPDRFELDVLGGQSLLDTTFSNVSLVDADQEGQPYPQVPQSYPNTFGNGTNEPGTGADAVGRLGYGSETRPLDTTYRLQYRFEHDSPQLRMAFSASGLDSTDSQKRLGERWGLDNVSLEAGGADHYVNLGPGEVDSGNNFGNTEPRGRLVGTILRDANGNQTADAGEFGINGRQVKLVEPGTDNVLDTTHTRTIDLNGDGLIDPQTERGVFRFTGLEPDNYEARYFARDGYQLQTAPRLQTSVDKYEASEVRFIVTPQGNNIAGQMFEDTDRDGEKDSGEPLTQGETVYLDVNDNGNQGTYSRTLSYDPRADEVNDNTTIRAQSLIGTVQDMNVSVDLSLGQYSGLRGDLVAPNGQRVQLFDLDGGEGQYQVTFDDAATDPSPSAPDTGDNNTHQPMESLSAFNGIDASGTWRLDMDIFATDPSEVQVNGWSINPTLNEPSTTTDADGRYSFADVAPGTLAVRQEVPSGLQPTLPDPRIAGSNAYQLRLEPGAQFTSLDFANVTPLPDAQVEARHVFYNQSAFDDDATSANMADNNALATDKQALLPGETGAFENYTSYDEGLNGIMVDIANLAAPEALTADDFTFKVGRSDDPSTWSQAPSPTIVDVRPGDGVNNSDRVSLIWQNDTAVTNDWLQVTVKATAQTGLPSADVFYFGNAIGETGNDPNNTFVNGSDFALVRDNPHNFFVPAEIDDNQDINRDTFVNGTDLALVRDNPANFFTSLPFISVPQLGGSSTGSADANTTETTETDEPRTDTKETADNSDLTFSPQYSPQRDASGSEPSLVDPTANDQVLTESEISAQAAGDLAAMMARDAKVSANSGDPIQQAIDDLPDPLHRGVDYFGKMFEVNVKRLTTGESRDVPSTLIGVSRSPQTGQFYTIAANGDIYQLDPKDGSTTRTASIGRTLNEGAMAFTAAGELHIIIERQDGKQTVQTLYQVGINTGKLTQVNDLRDVSGDISAMAFTPGNDLLTFDPREGVLWTIPRALGDIGNGEPQKIVEAGGDFAGMDFHNLRDELYIATGDAGQEPLMLRLLPNKEGGYSIDALNQELAGRLSGLEVHKPTVVLPDGADKVDASLGNDSVRGDHQIPQALYDDGLRQDGGADELLGGQGQDTIRGQQKDDILWGADAEKETKAANDDDDLIGGEGEDTVRQTVDSEQQILKNKTLTGQGTDSLTGIERAHLVGGPSDNTIDASQFDGPNKTGVILEGMMGDDTLTGSPYADIFRFNDTKFADTDRVGDVGGVDVLDFANLQIDDPARDGVTVDLSSQTMATHPAGSGQREVINTSGPTDFENIIGTAGEDDLRGNSDANLLFGGASDDTMNGGGGDDTYRFLPREKGQRDNVDDTGGRDTLDFSALDAAQPLNIDLNVNGNFARYPGGGSQFNVLNGPGSEFEVIRGGDGNDRFTDHNGSNNTFYGQGGDDRYQFGDDSNGNVASQQDRIVEPKQGGTDWLEFSQIDNASSAISLDQGSGSSTDATVGNRSIDLSNGAHFENVLGGDGDDSIIGNAKANVLKGNAGNDFLDGQGGDDTLTGGPGGDSFAGGLGDDTYKLLDGSSNDRLIDAGGENDLIDLSQLDVANSGTETTVELNAGAGGTVVTVEDNGTTQYRLGFLTGEQSRLEDVIGTVGSDIIRGNNASNVFMGLGGADTLVGRLGADDLSGGTGDDDYRFGNTSFTEVDIVREPSQSADGTDSLTFDPAALHNVDVNFAPTSGSQHLLAEQKEVGSFGLRRVLLGSETSPLAFENAYTADGNDTLTGNANDNHFEGGAGRDILKGGFGQDDLRGQGGNDTLMGGQGDDKLRGGASFASADGQNTLVGGGGDDRYIFEENVTAIDTLVETNGNVRPGTGLARGGGVDTLDFSRFSSGFSYSMTFKNYELLDDLTVKLHDDQQDQSSSANVRNYENLIGGSGDDGLVGNDQDNKISGGQGQDTIYGLEGDDTIGGEAGDDTLYGNAGDDILLGGQGTDELEGGAGADIVLGGSGGTTSTAEQLSGGAGRDLLIGQTGVDELNGNAGQDILISEYTIYAFNFGGGLNDAYEIILSYWNQQNLSYTDRVDALSTGIGDNNQYRFTWEDETTDPTLEEDQTSADVITADTDSALDWIITGVFDNINEQDNEVIDRAPFNFDPIL
jgi:Ca2+-binding RTX toxin-like protein/protocatechuate 3,4-dioxygenase beta subunit